MLARPDASRKREQNDCFQYSSIGRLWCKANLHQSSSQASPPLGHISCGNRELERRTMRLVRSNPQSSTMRFNDGSADSKTHPHSVWFGRVKWVEDAVRSRGVETWACVAD